MTSTPAPTTRKYLLVLLFLVLLLVAGGALYWLMFRRDYLPTKFFKLDETIPEEAGVEYERVFREPPAAKVTDLDPDRSDPSLTQILQGYFYSYEADQDLLTILNQFRGDYLQQLTVSLDQVVGFYCWPEQVEGLEGKIKTKDLQILVPEDGKNISMPDEKFINLELLPDFVNQERYLIIQLFKPFELGADNQVQKLVLVGC